MFANRFFVGCLAFGLVLLVAGGLAGVVLYANRDRLPTEQRSEETTQAKEDGHLSRALPQLPTPNGSALDRLRRHPWWASPLPPSRAEDIITEIYALGPREALAVFKTGKTGVSGTPSFVYRRDASGPFGDLAGGADSVAPVIFPVRDVLGRPMLSRGQVIAGLIELLDWAHASEESFRRTGKGMTNQDSLFQAEVSPSTRKAAQRRSEELKNQPRPRPAPIVEQQQK